MGVATFIMTFSDIKQRHDKIKFKQLSTIPPSFEVRLSSLQIVLRNVLSTTFSSQPFFRQHFQFYMNGKHQKRENLHGWVGKAKGTAKTDKLLPRDRMIVKWKQRTTLIMTVPHSLLF